MPTEQPMTKFEVIQQKIKTVAEIIMMKEIDERYLQRVVLKGNKNAQGPLGNTQTEIKERKDYLAFLYEILADETKKKSASA